MSRQQVPNFQILNNGVSLISAPDRVAGPLIFMTGGIEYMRLDGNLYLNNWLMLTHSPSGGTYPAFGATGDDRTAIYGGPLGIRFSGNTGTELANLSAAGSLTLPRPYARIYGDMTNALSQRLTFETNVPNGTTNLQAWPNGSATQAGLLLFNRPNPDNAGIAEFNVTDTGVNLSSTRTGTATQLPINFLTGGFIRAGIETNGDITISGSTTMFKRWGTNTGISPRGAYNLGVGNSTPLFSNYEQGYVFINVPALAASALFYMRGGAASVSMIYNAVPAPNYQFSTTKNTADSHNFYFESGSYILQNKANTIYQYTVIYLRME